MNLSLLFRPAVLTLFLAAGWAAPSLLDAWQNAPLERGNWPLLVLWLLPCAGWWRHGGTRQEGAPSSEIREDSGILTAFALVALVAGAVLEMNVFRHMAFALALAALAPRGRWGFPPWLAASIAWMPAAGWITAGWPSPLPDVFRALMGLAGVSAWFLSSCSLASQTRAAS